MKKSKNLGVCKSCPSCRKTLLKEVNIDGKGTLKTKCPHCKALVVVEVDKKTSITVAKIILGVAILISLVQVYSASVRNNEMIACVG